MTVGELELRGAGGEPVDLLRTLVSHGVAELPPMSIDEQAPSLEVTLLLSGGRARRVRVEPARRHMALVTTPGRAPSKAGARELLAAIEHILRLDEDLSEFYEMTAADPDLAWVSSGAGRMIRSRTVFEEVVKTVCTTNCTWSATVRMVNAIAEHLGEAAADAPPQGPAGRAFPTPEAMAAAGAAFYKKVARAGYRSAYLVSLARSVANGKVDVEELGRASADELPDEELERRLLTLPGVGPYAAAHIMTMLGRYSRLIFDSWTRPKYARLVGKKKVSDRTIERRFGPYGRYAGLAFWLYLTRDWVEDG